MLLSSVGSFRNPEVMAWIQLSRNRFPIFTQKRKHQEDRRNGVRLPPETMAPEVNHEQREASPLLLLLPFGCPAVYKPSLPSCKEYTLHAISHRSSNIMRNRSSRSLQESLTTFIEFKELSNTLWSHSLYSVNILNVLLLIGQ